MYEAYRVRRRFQWRGWEYAPSGPCQCSQEENAEGRGDCKDLGCTGEVGTGCKACYMERCRCACNIPVERYGGDVWIVEEGHPRKDMILGQRLAIKDVTLSPADELVKEEQYSRLLSHPVIVKRPAKRRVKSAVE